MTGVGVRVDEAEEPAADGRRWLLGDAQVFRLLRDVLAEPAWQELADRCRHTVTHSGLPSRPRPGLWADNGRC
ncbi:hypothetical protein [Streptomyces sp. NPDC048737]|uniref:hypothetical protein n=1 Tax=unclassified Streptomyces TaxID=2593676 RepID=UPI0034198264